MMPFLVLYLQNNFIRSLPNTKNSVFVIQSNYRLAFTQGYFRLKGYNKNFPFHSKNQTGPLKGL